MIDKNSYFEPFVSIALATYNGERYIREQIDSLLSQTYQNFELVISDDGSTDDTQIILEEYSKKDERVCWTKNNKGRGVVTNFSEAILKCRGEIVFLCDQDDFWYPDKISKHVTVYQDKSVAWAYNELVVTDENRKHTGYLTDNLPDYWTRRNFLYYTWGSCVLGCVTSYRRKLLDDIWPADINAPGHDSWIQLAIYPAKSARIAEVLQDYRQHSNNVVGLKPVPIAELAKLENKAIENNMKYIASLATNKKLQFWKRIYFSSVYLVKKIRSYVRRLL